MEDWIDIPDYPGYKINSIGSISGRRKNNIKTQKSNKGYICVTLSNEFGKKTFKVHRLVAICFVPNEFNKPQVDHIDGNKENNDFRNLRWVTNKENSMNSVTYNKLKEYYKTEEGLSHLRKNGIKSSERISNLQKSKRIKIGRYSADGTLLDIHFGIKQTSREFGIHHYCIISCCKGEQKTAGGFIWKYL